MYRPEREDACQDDDDEVVLPHEWDEPWYEVDWEAIDDRLDREDLVAFVVGPIPPATSKSWGRTLI